MTDRLSGPSLFALVHDLSGPTLWRCLWPITALERRGYPCGWDFAPNTAARALVTRYQGLLLGRVSWAPFARKIVERAIDDAHDAGRFVVYDLDDDLLSIDFQRRQIELGWTDGKTYEQLDSERQERIWAVRQVDGLTVSTEPLARLVASYTSKPIIVVENAIDLAWFRTALARRRRELPAPTIGWSGGMRPDRDVATMAAAWARIAGRYPGVRFVVAGYVPPVVRDAIAPSRLVTVPWLPLERYPEPLVEIDIACCSVADDAFNAYKSQIKAYEAAVAGAAVVASPLLYGRLIRHGETGYLAETLDDWETALADLVERPARRAMLARRLLRQVEKSCSLTDNLGHWPAAWAAIAADTSARHRRLVTR